MPLTASVIVCTYNRRSLLKRLLQAISSQTLHPETYEVLVVDDGSTDDTAAVCSAMMSKMSNLKYLPTGKNLGLPAAQNIALGAARGKHLLFTDDDCVPERDWAAQLSEALNHEPIVAGAVATPRSHFMIVCHNIAEFHRFMPGRAAGYTDFIAGANMGFRRRVIDRIGPFRPDLRSGNDTELVLRAREHGYTVYFEPRAIVLHDPLRTSFTDIMQYAADHAAETIHLRNQYQALLKTPFILKAPALILAASPLIALRVTTGIFIKNRKLAPYLGAFPVIFTLKLAWCWGAARGLSQDRKLSSYEYDKRD